MKIQFRLLLLTISLTTVAVVVALLISTYLTRDALVADATEKLAAVLEARHSAVTRHLDTTHRQMHILAQAPSTARDLTALSAAHVRLGGNAQTLLQQNYLAENVSSKIAKSAIIFSSGYDQALRLTDPFFQRRHDTYGWEDMFLIDPQGNVVYSVLKESDFGTNLVSGPWKDTGLARAVKPLLHDATEGVMSFADFERYAPSAGRPAAFLAMPVFDAEKSSFLGVVAIQLPVQQINELMQDKTGLGESGETFLVGKDGFMLTNSRFRQEGAKLGTQLKTIAVSKVLKGESGLEQFPDYRGIDVYVAFKPIRPFKDSAALGDEANWGVIAKIDKAEVYEEFYTLRRILLLTGALLVMGAVAVGVWGARGITRPLFGIRDALVRLSRGEVAEVPGLERRDEIGEMAKAAEAFREMTQRVERDHWIAENVAALTGAVSVESRIDMAAESVLHLLCEKLDVPVAAIYLRRDDVFQRVGAHGLARRSQAEDRFHLGAGLVGQCAKDNQAEVLSPVPEGLSIISTGLAEFPPHELVLYPIAHKNEVLAVLELAATKSLTSVQHDFLKTASAALGLHLANLQASEHNLVLLEETRRQSAALNEQQEELLRSNEELHALTEELRSQAEEMKAQNEELKANQEELRAQQEEMKHKNHVLETQSAQLEEVLAESRARAEELQRANQYKSEFLANMSHELRTPLNSVLILSRDLAENGANNLTSDQVESATVISESGAQLLTLINDILDLSKIEAGKMEMVSETFELDDLLAYLRRIFMPQAEKKKIAFSIHEATSLPETIRTDRQRLTQILTNLLSNAIKFTDSGEVNVSVGKDHKSLWFEVADSGIGIAADKMEHIFGAFHQVDGSTSRKYGGSGLGLAISRHLAELLGGKIEVKSEPGKGSRFTVRLLDQLADAAQPSKVKPQAPAVPNRLAATRGSILVVEDDTRLLSILGRMIDGLGFKATCVESGEQALEAVAREMPLGILLDLGLPHMSGMELLRRLKGDKDMANIPVYIMSGASDTGEAKVLGALGFLKKPVTRDTISAAIRAMMAEAPSVPTAPGVKRILLADGNVDDIAAIRSLFGSDAVELISADTGSGAISLLKAQRFDTVILDLQLPDMTGFAWLKQARDFLNPPPVVVYSSRVLNEDEVFELKQVAESIVMKGATNDRLREEVLLAAHLDVSTGRIAAGVSPLVAGKKLLLVDDDARNLYALTKALRAKGYAIEVAPDSVKALELLNQERFDAVLTDIMMPDMDGYALIRQIRALGYNDLPLIAITAKAMQGDDVLCMQAGATAYLSKPVDMTKLLDLLKGV